MTPTWSILIPTLGRRRAKFVGLLDVLLPQALPFGEGVEVVAYHNNGERPLGEIRQALVMAAEGDYLSFIDDDDMICDDFVPTIMARLPLSPDCVGFQVAYTVNGTNEVLCHCSIRFTSCDTDTAMFRSFTHVQPVKTSLARMGDFRASWPEDSAWAAAVLPAIRSEQYIERVMYHYRFNSEDSVQLPVDRGIQDYPLQEVSHPRLRYISAGG